MPGLHGSVATVNVCIFFLRNITLLSTRPPTPGSEAEATDPILSLSWRSPEYFPELHYYCRVYVINARPTVELKSISSVGGCTAVHSA